MKIALLIIAGLCAIPAVVAVGALLALIASVCLAALIAPWAEWAAHEHLDRFLTVAIVLAAISYGLFAIATRN